MFERGCKPPYRKTIAFGGDYIDDFHKSLLEHPLRGAVIDHPIEGWLRPADAAKLYELAYFSDGDILELGTYAGLSAFIMSQALRANGRQAKVHTVDLSSTRMRWAKRNLIDERGITNVVYYQADGTNWLKRVVAWKAKFGFAFIDHSHEYVPVREACELIGQALRPGSFVAFHDFVDARNSDPNDELKVLKAVTDGLPRQFSFYGAFGCTGIYRYEPSPWVVTISYSGIFRRLRPSFTTRTT